MSATGTPASPQGGKYPATGLSDKEFNEVSEGCKLLFEQCNILCGLPDGSDSLESVKNSAEVLLKYHGKASKSSSNLLHKDLFEYLHIVGTWLARAAEPSKQADRDGYAKAVLSDVREYASGAIEFASLSLQKLHSPA